MPLDPSTTRVRIIGIQTDGSYYQEWAKMNDTFCIGKGTEILRLAKREVFFTQASPIRLRTVEELMELPNPEPSFETGIKVGVFGHENPWPVTFHDEYVNSDDIKRELRQINRTTRYQRALETMAKGGSEQVQAHAIMFAGIALAIMATLFAVVVTFLFLIPRFSN